jgi:uncharacterized protein
MKPLRSCIYECTVMHHRLVPRRHEFRYRIFMFALDLDEIDAAATRVRGFSRNRWNLYTFRDRDHVSIVPGTVKENVMAYLSQNGVTLPDGARVLLVTLPRILGYIFNPVSFYFCTAATGEPLCTVAQVGNTFGEMKLYLLGKPAADGIYRLITPKHFYVSPFSKLDLEFDFKLREPGEHLEIHIDDREGERPTLLSALTGRRAPLTSARLAWLTLKYPLLTLRVIFLIHWNALLLWLKGVPWFAKTARPEDQRAVLRPHASLFGRSP